MSGPSCWRLHLASSGEAVARLLATAELEGATEPGADGHDPPKELELTANSSALIAKAERVVVS
jgi:hypothetical protein